MKIREPFQKAKVSLCSQPCYANFRSEFFNELASTGLCKVLLGFSYYGPSCALSPLGCLLHLFVGVPEIIPSKIELEKLLGGKANTMSTQSEISANFTFTLNYFYCVR